MRRVGNVCLCDYQENQLNYVCSKKSIAASAIYIIGRPIPRPGIPPACGMSLADLGLLIVSSTERIRLAASQAAVKALILIIEGSQTQASKLSAMCSLLMSTPYQMFPEMMCEHVSDSFD